MMSTPAAWIPWTVVLAVAACTTVDPEPPETRQLTPAELAALLQSGVVPPVTESDEEREGAEPSSADSMGDPFARFQPDGEMATDPFAEPVERFEPEPDPDPEPEPVPETPAPAPPAPSGGGPLALFEENPYLTFGRRIKIYPDGSITKPYPLRPGTGEKMLQLIESYGNFPVWTTEMGTGPSPPSMVKLDLLKDWDVELVQDLRNVNGKASPNPVADWLVVTTGEDLLWEVEEFINLFAAGVPQIEIEAKIVEITFTESLDIGVKPIDGATPIFSWPTNVFVKSFDFATSNLADTNEGLLTLGAVEDGFAFNAILEAIATSDNVQIISQPKVAVREGGRAHLLSTQRIPYLEITTVNNNGGFNTTLNYLETGVQLYVVPRVVGTDTVALDIDIEASQQTGDQIVATAPEPLSVPILSQRTARTVVYLRPGQAVILGGLINERNVERERKVPLLGDIPLLGALFRSKLTLKEESNVLFFIRPRILQGADLSREF